MTTETKDRKPRKKAPEIDVDEMIRDVYRDERAEIAEAAKESLGEKADGMHFCYQRNREDASLWKRRGYEQVKINGKNINHKGDPLTMCTEQDSFKQREAPALLAQRELEEAKVAAGENYGTKDDSGISHGLEKMGD